LPFSKKNPLKITYLLDSHMFAFSNANCNHATQFKINHAAFCHVHIYKTHIYMMYTQPLIMITLRVQGREEEKCQEKTLDYTNPP